MCMLHIKCTNGNGSNVKTYATKRIGYLWTSCLYREQSRLKKNIFILHNSAITWCWEWQVYDEERCNHTERSINFSRSKTTPKRGIYGCTAICTHVTNSERQLHMDFSAKRIIWRLQMKGVGLAGKVISSSKPKAHMSAMHKDFMCRSWNWDIPTKNRADHLVVMSRPNMRQFKIIPGIILETTDQRTSLQDRNQLQDGKLPACSPMDLRSFVTCQRPALLRASKRASSWWFCGYLSVAS